MEDSDRLVYKFVQRSALPVLKRDIMATDIDDYIDTLQDVICDLKARPKDTELLSVVIRHHKGNINTIVFVNASDDVSERMKVALADIASNLVQAIH